MVSQGETGPILTKKPEDDTLRIVHVGEDTMSESPPMDEQDLRDLHEDIERYFDEQEEEN